MARKKRETPDLTQQWADYKGRGSRRARDEIIEAYYPLVKYVASRLKFNMMSSLEQDDLVSYGVFGLIDAIDKFDLSKGIKFETYAVNRIRGAIIDEVRSVDRIPRSVRSKIRDIEKATLDLVVELQRQPTREELAERLGITVVELHANRAHVSNSYLVPLEQLFNVSQQGDMVSMADTIKDAGLDDPEENYTTIQTTLLLAKAMDRLSRRDSIVLALYYTQELTLADIGRVLGVTESRVCQLHTQAIQTLRDRIGG